MERTQFLMCVLVLAVSVYAVEAECRRRVHTGGSGGGYCFFGIPLGEAFGGFAYILFAIVAVAFIYLFVRICIRRARGQNPSINARRMPLTTSTGHPYTGHSVSKPCTATHPGCRESNVYLP